MTNSFKLGSGATPLIQAIFRRDDAIALELIQSGADANVRDSNGRTALHYLCRENRWYLMGNRHEEVDYLLLELLAASTDVNAADYQGDTPLHLAAALGSDLLAQVLVAAGADVMHRNVMGETPMATAKARDKSDMVKYLHDRMEAISSGSGVLDLLPISVHVNPITGEAITTARFGQIAIWQDTDAGPVVVFKAQTEWSHDEHMLIAVPPDGETFLLTEMYHTESIEIRRWSDFAVEVRIDLPRAIVDLEISPNGRWLAGCGESEELLFLIERATGKIVTDIDAGERTGPVAFDDASELIATACSFQGGANIRVDRIEQNGEITPLYVVWLSDRTTSDAFFVDGISGVAINREENLLAIFATSSINHDLHPDGWYGYIAVCDLQTGKRLWVRSIDSEVIGDKSSVNHTGHFSVYSGDVLFLNPNEVTCSEAYDSLIVFDALTGVETRRIPLGHNYGVRSFALDRQRKRLWTVSAQSEMRIYDV